MTYVLPAAELVDPDGYDWPDEYTPERPPDPADDERDTWAPIDLGPYLRGEIARPEPTLGLTRSDGLRVIYPGKEHAVIGEMEAGKSWFALGCAVAEITAGRSVVYIHFEEADPSDTVERMVALGAGEADMLRLFRFVGPERRITPRDIGRLVDPPPSLVIFDGVNEGMSLHRAAIREEDGAATFRKHVIKPFIRVGAATLACDHVVKDKEARGRYALGSIHKGNALSGVQLMLECLEPFGRDQRGVSAAFVVKDRPGYLRRHGKPTKVSGKTFIGTLIVDAMYTDLGRPLEMKFWAPRDDEPAGHSDGEDENGQLVDEVHRALSGTGSVESERELFAVIRAAGIKARNTEILRALDDLVYAKRLETFTGPRKARGYRVPTASHKEPA